MSRWRCERRRCDTAIFADRLTGVTAWRGQHTQRFGAVGHLVAHALGGRGGERLLSRLGMAISDSTILRLLTRPVVAPPAPEVLRVVGIDDWAWQKGQHHYGTILVDLERRRVVDALPMRPMRWRVVSRPSRHRDHQPRSARAVCGESAPRRAAGHPGRRSLPSRAQPVRRGPTRTESAARRPLDRVRSRDGGHDTVRHRRDGASPSPLGRRRSAATVSEQRRALQLERFQRVKRLQAAGRTAQAIMRETGLGRAYVRRWVYLSELPTRNRMAPRAGMAEFYRDYLRGRWADGCQNGRLLLAEIQARGYIGCYAGLAKQNGGFYKMKNEGSSTSVKPPNRTVITNPSNLPHISPNPPPT